MKFRNLCVILIIFKFVITSEERLVVTGADEPVYAHAGEDVTLSCSVDTHVNVTELQVEWKKTEDDGDILVLLYAGGGNRPESQDGRYSGRAEFFTEEIPKGNFSMKLRKVRTEDKGEFMCEVHINNDSANATARIAALGYSSLHWLILVLCVAVTPVLLVAGVFSVLHLIMQTPSTGSENTAAPIWGSSICGDRLPVLCHCSLVLVPSIMMSSAFILWGATEGSIEEAVTCTVVSLLRILMLCNMAPYMNVFTGKWAFVFKYKVLRIGNTIMTVYIVTAAVIEFSAKYPTNTAGKVIFGSLVCGFVFLIIFMVFFRFADIVFSKKYSSTPPEDIIVKTAFIIGCTFLITMASSIIGFGVYFVKYSSDTMEKVQVGTFLTVFIVPIITVLFPFVATVFMIIPSVWSTGSVQLKKLLSFWALFMYHPIFFNMQSLVLYNQLIAWMHNTLILGYLIPISVAALGICACFVLKTYLGSCIHFYLGHKILLGILFMLHLILSFQYLSLILENDKGWLVKLCEYAFVYVLTVTSGFEEWLENKIFAKFHTIVYFSAAFVLPFTNSVALAVALKLKADTGKQSLDQRLIVLIFESVVLFSWFSIKMSYFCVRKQEKILVELALVQRSKDTVAEPVGAEDTSDLLPGRSPSISRQGMTNNDPLFDHE